MSKFFYSLASVFAFYCAAVQAQVPEWIWSNNGGAAPTNNEVRFFRKSFSIKEKPTSAFLSVAADDSAEVWINGKPALTVPGWNEAARADISKRLKAGDNLIAIRAMNTASDAALIVRLEMVIPVNRARMLVSDASWRSSATEEKGWETPEFKPAGRWAPAVSRGKLGMAPWGEVMKSPQATAPETLTLPPGFKVELLRSASAADGSWICMTTDAKGRLIISPQQENLPLWRVTLSKAGQIEKWEAITAPIHQAMGMLYAHDSLYVNGHGPQGTGLYRLVDENNNDQFEASETHFLKTIPGEGEHGYHALVLGPDKMIYMMNGNHTKLPEGIAASSPHKNYKEDLFLPRQWDANGHAVGILAPGGYVVRTDKEGKTWELMLAGFRNTYDFDFNADGELFAFDSDMEWDWGLPWYRPTRINHCVIGAEFGWRSGSAVWPDYYADSLPAAVNIGLGSPTGVKFGTKSNFPEKYKKAMFAMDWSYGRIFAVHLTPNGATYTGSTETFIKGKPLNVTDMDFGKDGAMYFTTGGRGTQAGLYRVTYVGEKTAETKSKQVVANEKAATAARALRHKLESYYKKDPKALDFAWPHLNSEDRFIRYAARIAVEWQDVASWKDRALAETNVDAGLTSLIALARCGGKETQRDLLLALKKFPVDSLSDQQKMDKLRIIELSLIRQGKPEPEMAKLIVEKLDQYYPTTSEAFNRELCQILVFLEAPNVAQKTLALLDKAATQEEQIFYIFQLRNLKTGWTLDQRKKYFSWFHSAKEAGKGEVTYPGGAEYNVWPDQAKATQKHPAELLGWFKDAGRDYGDGASFGKYLINIRKDAVDNLSDNERGELASFIIDQVQAPKPKAVTVQRKLVKEWTMADVEPSLNQVGSGRNFESGKAAFTDAQCMACHRFGNDGGAIGPELTVASSKYARRDILSSIFEPSKVLSEQFENFIITKKDGDEVIGRIVDENDSKIVIQPNPLANDRVEIKKTDIEKRTPSKLSPMPEGLLNNFTKEEILDLLAYIESSGKKNAANFKK